MLIGAFQSRAAKTHLNMGMVLEPPHLDPTAGAAAAIDEVVYANVFEGLTRINRNGEVLPALAKSWEISGDGLKYTFIYKAELNFTMELLLMHMTSFFPWNVPWRKEVSTLKKRFLSR